MGSEGQMGKGGGCWLGDLPKIGGDGHAVFVKFCGRGRCDLGD